MKETQKPQSSAPQVYAAIVQVMADIGKQGIAKGHKNDQQGYKFRGIDDVYNALAPILADNGLCVLPFVKSRDVVERQTQRGGTLFYVTVAMDFTLVSMIDGSSHVISACGEAMDSGDKATNKAMSAAYKYACMQAFCIPTEGDNDADKTTHEVTPIAKSKPAPAANGLADLELKTILNLAKTTGTDLAAICNAYGIKKIEDLPADKAGEVIARLQAKGVQAAQASTQATTKE